MAGNDRRLSAPPESYEFPQLSRRAGDAHGRRAGGAHRRERRRQDQSDRGDLAAWRPAAACAAPRLRSSPSWKATAPGRCRPRSRACWGSRRSAPASSHPPARTPPPPGNAASTAKRCRRPQPSPTTCAWSGSRRPWTGCSTARPPSGGVFSIVSCWRWTPAIRAASPRSSARYVRATACWKRRKAIRIGSTQSSTRPPRWRWRSQRRAPRR